MRWKDKLLNYCDKLRSLHKQRGRLDGKLLTAWKQDDDERTDRLNGAIRSVENDIAEVEQKLDDFLQRTAITVQERGR